MTQTQHFAVQADHVAVQEFVASGKNENGKIVLSFIHSEAIGDVITQTTTTQHCHWFLFWKKCHNEYDPRGFTTDELIAMQNGLLYYGYTALLDAINGQ